MNGRKGTNNDKYEETELSVTSFDVRFRININAGVPPTFSIRSTKLNQIIVKYLYAGTGTNNITLSFSELYGFDDFDNDGDLEVGYSDSCCEDYSFFIYDVLNKA